MFGTQKPHFSYLVWLPYLFLLVSLDSFCSSFSFPLHFLVQISSNSSWIWLLGQLSGLRRLHLKYREGISVQKSTKIMRKIFRRELRLGLELTFCQKIDFMLVSNGAPLFDSSYHSVERKGLVIIKDVQQASMGFPSLCRHKGYQDTSNRGASAWGYRATLSWVTACPWLLE